MRWMAMGICGLILGGCAGVNRPAIVDKATEGEQKAMLGQIKALEGTWVGKSPEGDGSCVFTVSSNGSIVREIMFPGAPHEMTNIYHMDGPTMLVTHYCASGNQPRMRATSAMPGEIVFVFDSITDYKGPSDHCMGSLTLTMKDNDHLTETWRSCDAHGQIIGEPTVFSLTRKK